MTNREMEATLRESFDPDAPDALALERRADELLRQHEQAA